ncbi:MAG TPA: hypothetical protein VM889_04705 [Candidatus Thermoplasmatota archaeon]|nr:hypothetical protein [Candidatus Thermoplasmatota archaeon]
MRPKLRWDFHDYLELRRARDRGEAAVGAEARLAWLERGLPVPFAPLIPRLVDPLRVPDLAYPRGLGAAEVRFLFEAREEFARLGETRRRRLTAFDLATEADGLKDWLDFVEAERRAYKEARRILAGLDRRIYAAFTGQRETPSLDVR